MTHFTSAAAGRSIARLTRRFVFRAFAPGSIFIVVLSVGVLGLFPQTGNAQVKLSGARQLSVAIGGQVPAGTSGSPIIAPNGRYIAFRSDAGNLVVDDTNGTDDVFLRDLATGALSRISVGTSGQEGDAGSRAPAVSNIAPDGFFAVAFESLASTLDAAEDSLGFRDIFVRYPTLGVTRRISLGVGNSLANGDSVTPSLTVLPAPNRIVLVFSSAATNLVDGDTNNVRDIFKVTFDAPGSASQLPSAITTERLTKIGFDQEQLDGDSITPVLSDDGRFVAFASRATNLTAAGNGGFQQIYLHDAQTGSTTLVTKSSTGGPGNGDSSLPAVSYGGRYVVFLSAADNLVSNSPVGRTGVYLFDRVTGALTRVNVAADGAAGNGNASTTPSISPNGRFITFSDDSSNLVPGDTNGKADVFVRDTVSKTIARASISDSAAESNDTSDTTFAAGDRYNFTNGLVSYRSTASNLTQNPTNGNGDVFVASAEVSPPTVSRGALFEVPPDVAVSKRSSTIVMQPVAAVVRSSQPLTLSEARKKKVQYVVEIRQTQGGRDRMRKVSRRNSVTARNLKPGTYTARYRVESPNRNGTTTATGFSPRQTFSVPAN